MRSNMKPRHSDVGTKLLFYYHMQVDFQHYIDLSKSCIQIHEFINNINISAVNHIVTLLS